MFRAVILCWTLMSLLTPDVFGQIIPADRCINWNRSFIGVPGGIPNRRKNFCNVKVSIPGSNLVAKGDNVTDDSAALNAAFASCPADEVVYIPAGDYACLSPLKIANNNITIRGNGTATVLHSRLPNASWAFIHVGNYLVNSGSWIPVTSGATAGSTTVVVPTAPPRSVSPTNSSIIILSQTNDYSYVHSLVYNRRLVPNPTPNNMQKIAAWVTGTTANSITFWPPLPFGLTNSTVFYKYFSGGGVMGTGIEDLKVLLEGGKPDTFNIMFVDCFGCWVKNIESAYTGQAHIYATGAICCEFRDSYVHDFYGPGGGNNGEGIELYSNCSGCLIENNIAYHLYPGINTSGGSSGNVIDYNFGYDSHSGSDVLGNDFDANHGPHNVMNLWEGNVGCMFQSDGFYGSASHITLFRNYFSGVDGEGMTYHRICVDLTHWSDYFNIVGNVLGSPNWMANPPSGPPGVYCAPATSNYNYQIPAIYRFGFPNMGNNYYTGNTESNPATTHSQDMDTNVQATVLLADNFDYYHNAVVNPVSNLPPSLFYTSTPAWWPSNVPWPPIGPDLTPIVSSIPAQIRFAALPSPSPTPAPTP